VDTNELTFSIRRAVFQVNKKLGSGFLEKVYENAFLIELRNSGLKAEAQVPVKVRYKGQEIGEYFADIIVENQVILELKAMESLQKIHEASCLTISKPPGTKSVC
jgi:GxxExxY protein